MEQVGRIPRHEVLAAFREVQIELRKTFLEHGGAFFGASSVVAPEHQEQRWLDLDEPLPHTKELKLQCGGILGVARVMTSETTGPVTNIISVLRAATQRYGALANLPYQEIVHAVHTYEPRPRRK